jgi:hypothetical protein
MHKSHVRYSSRTSPSLSCARTGTTEPALAYVVEVEIAVLVGGVQVDDELATGLPRPCGVAY